MMPRSKRHSRRAGAIQNVRAIPEACHPESPRFASRAEGSQSPLPPRVSQGLSLREHWIPRSLSTPCHPERSLAMREANRQRKSKDPYKLAQPPAIRGVFLCAAGQGHLTRR